MATKTPNFEFTKPDVNEFYDVQVQNENWDKLDRELGKHIVPVLLTSENDLNQITTNGYYYWRKNNKPANVPTENGAENLTAMRVWSEDGYRSIHIPSLAVPRDPNGTSLTDIFAESEGYIVDVYDDYIILNGRDFIDNDADGHIIPIATYKIDTKLVEIEPNTFTDSTGTITT